MIEFKEQKLPFNSEPQIKIPYKGIFLKKYYVPDFLLYDTIVVEIKAMKKIGELEEAQLFNSIKACKIRLGLLINFGEVSLKWNRYIV